MTALLVAVVMMMALSAVAWGSTITVNPPDGTSTDAQNTYTYYKVFDATVSATDSDAVSYKLPEGVTEPPAGFSVDSAGNVTLDRTTGDLSELTAEEIAAIKAYVEANSEALASDKKTVTGTAAAEFGNLDAGYYYIATTTGTLVVVKSNNVNINVNDKNTVPTLTKVITDASGTLDDEGKNAVAQVGTDVAFQSVITVGKGMKSYTFHDKMDSGLKLNADSIEVTYSAKPTGYVEAAPVANVEEGTIEIAFSDGLAENTTITITYTATVTNDALTYVPEKNTAYVNYGNGPESGKTPDQVTKTYSAKISVVKYDGNNTEATEDDSYLAGAKFKLYKFDTDGTTKLYYKLNAATATAPASITWGAEADEHESTADGSVPAFVGLEDGTYYLEESVTPAGYNTAADVEVTINGTEYTPENLEQSKDVLNNKGGVLPSTGGMGTTILYIVGAVLIIGAVVLLITRRRLNAEK